MPDFFWEEASPWPVAGVDEVGRGPWAGPVLACAVVMDRQKTSHSLLDLLRDSKKLTKLRREKAYHALMLAARAQQVFYAFGWASPLEIDTLNIHKATLLAMTRAVEGLNPAPASLLVDGLFVPPCNVPGKALIKGDDVSYSIAAASILAKITRDQHMADLALEHPGYAWEKNAGYGTKLHQEGLARLGVTSHHRKSFAPIGTLLAAAA
jgi:ribonuclease HII